LVADLEGYSFGFSYSDGLRKYFVCIAFEYIEVLAVVGVAFIAEVCRLG
jgi:hypothetical protein